MEWAVVGFITRVDRSNEAQAQILTSGTYISVGKLYTSDPLFPLKHFLLPLPGHGSHTQGTDP
jgi:hypothetical protein